MSRIPTPEQAAAAVSNGHQAAEPAELRARILALLTASRTGARLRDITDHCGPAARDALDALLRDGLITFAAGWYGARPDDDETEAELPDAPPFPRELARGPLRDLLDWADDDGLPVSYMGAAAETVAAAAAARTSEGGPGARLALGGTRAVYPVLWQALIGESGDAKNPPPRIASGATAEIEAARLARWQDECKALAEDDPKPERPEALTLTSGTIESISRWLAASGGGGLMRNGELASFLRSLGQYKSGGGSDRYDALDMWSCEAITIERVGDGKNRNAVHIHVRCPRLSIVGGLTPGNVYLLGPEDDGLRARFLPVLASSPVVPNLDGSKPLPESWPQAMRQLHECGHSRTWYLRGEARAALKTAVERWTVRKVDGADPKVIRTALAKADEQAMRLALVVSELAQPGADMGKLTPGLAEGDIPLWAVEYAIARVEYALGCWATLGTDQVMIFSRKDEVLSKGVRELLTRIRARSPGKDGRRFMTRREIQQARIGGAVSPDQVNDLINSWLAQFPLCVTVYSEKDRAKFPTARMEDRADCPEPATRGPAPVVVWEPRRVPPAAVLPPEIPPHVPPKLLTSTVSFPCADSPAEDVPAGHAGYGDAPAHAETVEMADFNSFPSTVSGAAADASEAAADARPNPLRNARCPSCRYRFKTTVQPGEDAWCKKCGGTFAVPREGTE